MLKNKKDSILNFSKIGKKNKENCNQRLTVDLFFNSYGTLVVNIGSGMAAQK